AALVLTDEETARTLAKAVRFRAAVQVNDFLPISKRDITQFEGAHEAWLRALSQSGLRLDDLDFVETHDCFTIAELLEYEAMGLTPRGQGARAALEGWTQKDGRLPINRSGGRHAAAKGGCRRRVQHGRGRGRQLRVHPRSRSRLIPTSNLAALALGAARRFPDRDALIWRDRAWSWAELDERMRRAATGLVARGLRPGDRVLVHARNSNALFESMWATWMASGVWVPTNFRLTPTEVAYLAENCGAVLHIIDDAFPDHAAAARDANRVMRAEIAIPHGWEELATSGAARDAAADVDRDDPCWLFYTSGTTGRPKGGVLKHGQMNFVVTNHLADLMPGLTHHDASLVVAPLSHGAGVHQLSPASRGAPTILMPGERLDVPEAWRLIERHRVTNLFTV